MRRYEFIGTCSHTGKTVSSEKSSEDKDSVVDRHLLRRRVREVERGFILKGVGLLVFGMLLNLPYIILILSVEDNIRYQQSKS